MPSWPPSEFSSAAGTALGWKSSPCVSKLRCSSADGRAHDSDNCSARYYAQYIRNINEENLGSSPSDPVMVIQAMGRKSGFISAAARLADPNREMPLQIYLAESGLTLEAMPDLVNDELKRSGRCLVVVSEGFNVGSLGELKDSFGHTMFSSSQMTVAQVVVNHLNKVGL